MNNDLTGRRCILLPNEKRLKQLIKEHGNPWVIELGPIPMQCFDNEHAFRIRSSTGHVRNVRTGDVEVIF